MDQLGYIKLNRSFLYWRWYKKIPVRVLFEHLLLSANFTDTDFEDTTIHRGEILTGRKRLADETGLTEQQVRSALKKLSSCNELEIKSTNKYSIITICKYNTYVDNENKSNQQVTNKEPASNQQVTNKEPASNQQVTNKEPLYNNDNNDNKEKNDKNDKNDKKDNNIVASTFVDTTPSSDNEGDGSGLDFESVWKLYQRKGNKATAKTRYSKLSKTKKEEIIKYIPYYLAFTVPQYRKGFEVFISKEQWKNILQDPNGKEIPYLGADGEELYHVANVDRFKSWFNNLVSDTSIPKVQELTPDRQRNLNICYTLYPQCMEQAVRTVLDNPRYMDMANRGMISFDYIFNPTNLIKICENGQG